MFSVVIATENSERTLLPTLAALVPGAAAGVVREVIVADGGSQDTTARIADTAGCRLIVSELPRGARLKTAAATARASWLLFLEPGTVPDVTWIDETRRFVEMCEINDQGPGSAAVFRRGLGASRSVLAEAAELLRRSLGARPKPQQGLLIAKRLYEDLAGHDEHAQAPEDDLYRRLGRRRIALLPCSAVMVGK